MWRTMSGGGAPLTLSAAVETWECDGQAWTVVADTGPPISYGATVACDTSNKVTVLFGGVSLDTETRTVIRGFGMASDGGPDAGSVVNALTAVSTVQSESREGDRRKFPQEQPKEASSGLHHFAPLPNGRREHETCPPDEQFVCHRRRACEHPPSSISKASCSSDSHSTPGQVLVISGVTVHRVSRTVILRSKSRRAANPEERQEWNLVGHVDSSDETRGARTRAQFVMSMSTPTSRPTFGGSAGSYR